MKKRNVLSGFPFQLFVWENIFGIIKRSKIPIAKFNYFDRVEVSTQIQP